MTSAYERLTNAVRTDSGGGGRSSRGEPHGGGTGDLRNAIFSRVSGKLRPRKLRPQTRKTQTLGCLENSDLEKTQTLRCLENSDPKNSDPWMSRKLRPEKLRPSGCLENSDPKNKTYLHRVNAASRLVYCSLIQWH